MDGVTAGAVAAAPPAAAGPDLDAALARLGHATFRPGQREAIEIILAKRRLVLIAPTGGGKSLTFQLPALVLGGTTLVISPLVSLMQDQVSALTERGIPATYLAATLPADEMRRRMRALAAGEFSLAYVAPERLGFPGFRSLARDLGCPLLAIDEAHCISEWGHDFRPDYLAIGGLVQDLGQARVLACTATATPVVRDEIIDRLGLPADTPQLIRGFARPNLGLRVHDIRGGAECARVVDATLAEAIGQPGVTRGTAIIYAPTRRQTEEEAARLQDTGWNAEGYHAGMDGATRERVQGQFRDGDLEVIVATNAFGMGIDRADVRAVIHLAPPGSVEAYYQEVGRAGRDGEPAIGVMCTSPSDLALRRRLLDMPGDNGPSDPARVAHRWQLFLELMRWAEGGTCRHDAILRYFGDEAETLSGCGRCDTCTALDEPDAADAETIATTVRKALSAVARMHGRFGLQAAVKLLAGASDPRLERSGLQETRTFGALKGKSEDWLLKLMRRCVAAGWVDFTSGDRPVVLLTPAGKVVLFAQGPVRFLLPPEGVRAQGASRPAGSNRARRAVLPPLDESDEAMFEALRARRLALAREEAVPPYVIASDRTLRELAEVRPRSLGQLTGIYGIGPAKVSKYGEAFMEVLRG